ncbi:MAG: hypothetical protein ACYDCC_13015 [Actinomycetota bacterium]
MQRDVQRWFDRMASWYERAGVFTQFIQRAQDNALGTLNLQSTDRFLDVGCGTGRAVAGTFGALIGYLV